MDFNRDFLAKNILARRTAKGWTQEKLADEAGVTKLTVSNYERKQRDGNPITIHKLATALGVSSADLMRDPSHYDARPARQIEPDQDPTPRLIHTLGRLSLKQKQILLALADEMLEAGASPGVVGGTSRAKA